MVGQEGPKCIPMTSRAIAGERHSKAALNECGLPRVHTTPFSNQCYRRGSRRSATKHLDERSAALGQSQHGRPAQQQNRLQRDGSFYGPASMTPLRPSTSSSQISDCIGRRDKNLAALDRSCQSKEAYSSPFHAQ